MFTRTLTLAAVAASLCLAQSERTFERTLSVSGPVRLDVSTDSGGIVVKAGPAGSVRIRGILKPQRMGFLVGNVEESIRRLEQNPPVEQTGNSIRAGYVTDRGLLRGVSMRLEITTPAQTEVRARADSGGVRVEGVTGPVDCATDSGGIEAQTIGGNVNASADSGGIRLRGIKGSVYARADSGRITALEVGGEIDAQTDSGGIELSQMSAARVRARADSGGVSLQLAPNGGYEIRARSDSGRVTAPEMTVRGTTSRNRVEGKVRGGGPLVDIAADSGRVEIR